LKMGDLEDVYKLLVVSQYRRRHCWYPQQISGRLKVKSLRRQKGGGDVITWVLKPLRKMYGDWKGSWEAVKRRELWADKWRRTRRARAVPWGVRNSVPFLQFPVEELQFPRTAYLLSSTTSFYEPFALVSPFL
jgi:hypothetical protein